MQAIFQEIIDGNIAKVSERLTQDPSLTTITATGAPKKYNGQSPLQVAVRSKQFAIASLLIEHGADVNFVDHHEDPKTWSAPVLHDAATVAVMQSQWLRPANFSKESPEWKLAHSQEQADEAFELLRLMLEKGADVEPLDSHKNSLLARVVLTARQILPSHRYNEPEWIDPRPLNDELVADLSRIFDILYLHGADPSKVDPHLEHPLDDFYAKEAVGTFLNRK